MSLPMTPNLTPEIRSQLAEIDFDPDKPLIITDADEVLLRFMVALEKFLENEGLWIDLKSFAINGNIKSRATNEPVQRDNLIDDFFAAATRHIGAVDHAAASLEKLASQAQIMVFTNLPLQYKQERIENLRDHGMDYPVLVGSGLKGPTLAHLATKTRAPIFFLDDIPHNIDSARDHSPDIHRIHFIADPRLAELVAPAKGASTRIDCWKQAHDWISSQLNIHGYD